MTIADPPVPVLAPVAPATLRPPRDVTRRPSRRVQIAETTLLAVAFGAATVAVAVRFVGPPALWLDEALTVNIARLPLPKLFDALRHDGSPPLYYLALHYWMGVFGTGTRAVRALAALFSLATLPAAWRLGRAVGGRRVATALVVVMACNPFALRYGTENRMYSLVMLLATLAALALVRALQHPSVSRLVLFGGLCGLLMLSHYWALYLMAGLGCCLLVASIWGRLRTHARLALGALCGGGLLFLPWAPSFVFQAQHTGTPWATAASPMSVILAVCEFAGYEQHVGIAVFVLYCVAFAVLIAATALRLVPAARPLLDWLGWTRPVPGSRLAGPVAAVYFVTMFVALAGGILASAAFAWRYASVVMPFMMLLVALGAVALGRSRIGPVATAALLAVLALTGTVTGVAEIVAPRTQANTVAAQIAQGARPGDIVAYCPDQLGPAVSRLLPDRLLFQFTFPRFDDPQRINWVDYSSINATANPGLFARQLLALAGQHQIWLVWESGYRTLGRSCQEIRDALEVARPDNSQPVRSQGDKYYEHENLLRFERLGAVGPAA